ncbi:ribulose 1,5-bisphosphate carboxylase large subunit [Thiohalocapsa marina]|uniref:Ribulose 1,5-bisphosphate carboxylase large subunit n=1 Tax=Thiohalocapsa marina TaxID=424902 RepID=A0A5M8FI73_9GAMM|nr:RuBisCO large subunit C-terminal-like domain-containing protein [Thiohalocapsa marina]KAA6184154.1 ribulose 1,5-bisphosphate carboxylase large subunit [Thiohalocapsa marina]
MTSALQLSGERFAAVYYIRAEGPTQAEARARAICLEQTVEFPEPLIPEAAIRRQIVGEIADLQAADQGVYRAVIRYPLEVAGDELTQLINVLFGNVSIQPGVRLMDFTLSPGLFRRYRGPRFGIAGLRERLGVHQRPLLCTAIKPMGLSPAQLADLAYRLALGGIDLIKDDHGLADQPFCRFDERVQRCAEAVSRANRETGQQALYLPNVTGPFADISRRAHLARGAGAGGLLFCPGLAGLDSMRSLADDDTLALPILSHPAFQGSLAVSPEAGLSHRVLFGLLNRLAGADAAIFPHFGGRFAYAEADCRDIVRGCTQAMAPEGTAAENGAAGASGMAPIFPVPAGGMRLDRIDELVRFYGRDCMLLIGGDLHAHGDDLAGSCRRFRDLAEAAVSH